MNRQLESDLSFVLSVFTNTADINRIESELEDMGNTVEQLDESLRRLGDEVGMEAGLL